MKNRYYVYALFLVFGVALDQWTKYLVVNHIQNANDFFHILPVLSIVRTHNTGVSFGMLSAFNLGPWFYGILVISIMAFLIYMVIINHARVLLQTAFVLMIGGAMGNLIDRFVRGYVVDFISAHWFGQYYFYVFNVADIFVSCGAALVILDAIIEKRTSSK